MKRLAFLALLFVGAAHAQAPSPAQIGVSATPPQSLYWLDSTKTWQPLPSVSTTNAWTGVNTWRISNVSGYAQNVMSVGQTSISAPMTAVPAALQIGNALYGVTAAQQSGNLNMGLNVITNPGNMQYDAAGYHYWNYIGSFIDAYWPTQANAASNVGLFVESRVNNSATQPNANVNGATHAMQVRATLQYPSNPSYVAAGAPHELIGAALEAFAPRGDGGVTTAMTAPAALNDTTLIVGSTTGMVNGDGVYVALDPYDAAHPWTAKRQLIPIITVVDGTTITFATTYKLKASVASGNPISDAKGQIFGHAGNASVGATAGGSVTKAIVDTEEDISVAAGTSVMYKANLTLVSVGPDAVQGSVYDAAIAVSKGASSASPGIRDAILFCACNSLWPIAPEGGLMKVDGHSTVAQTMGYGIDMSWATISATNGSNGYAFAFSTTGNGTPDNYWGNVGLRVSGPSNIIGTATFAGTISSTGVIQNSGGIQISGAPAVGVDTNSSTTTLAMRMGNNQSIVARNQAASANLALLQLDTSNTLVVGNATSPVKVLGVPTSAGAGGLFLCVDSAGAIYKKATCP